ncbi:MAG: V-type ATPase 116kDa subunit family protein [Candidatus Diapherotrites archaeon]
MLKPAKMKKFNVLLLSSDIQSVLDSFHDEPLLEFRRVDASGKGLSLFEASDKEKFAAYNLIRVRKIISFFKAHSKEPSLREKIKTMISVKEEPRDKALDFVELKKEIKTFLDPLFNKVETMEQRLKEISERINSLAKEKEILSAIAELEVHPSLISKYGNFEVIVGQIAPEFEGEFVDILKGAEYARLLKTVGVEEKTVLFLIDVETYNLILPKLRKIGFERLVFAETKAHPKYAIKRIEREIKSLEKEREKIISECLSLEKKFLKKVLVIQELLEIEKAKEKALQLFGRTEKTTLFEAFVPAELEKRFMQKLKVATKGRFYVEEVAFSEDEAPILLKHKGYFKNYEFLLKLYGLPEYNSIDPTIFIGVLYPILFGLAFSDVGYGLVFLAAMLAVRLTFAKRSFSMKCLSNIMIHGAITTILFGFVFGGFFGDLGGDSMKKLAIIDLFSKAPSGQSYTLLFIGSMWAIGLLHLNFAILLGFIEDLRKKDYKMALTDKMVYFILEAGLAFYAASFLLPGVQAFQFAGIILLIMALTLLVVSSGPVGLMKISGFVGNVLSYSRIMVLSISTFAIAMSINILAQLLFAVPVIGLVLGIAFLFFGHIANLLFNVLSSFIHPLRLHFVEFFSFFYSGSGKEFKPFYFPRKFTEKKEV